MPNIEEFSADSGQVGISDRGAESFAQAGRRVGAAFHQLGSDTEKTYNVFHAHQVDVDTNNTLTAQSTADVNAHNNLMQLVNDPRAGDHPEMGQALIDQYTKTQNDIASHASTEEGRRAGQRVAAERIDQFSQRVASEMATVAAGKAVQNVETYTQNSSAMAADDPSRVPNLLADMETHWGQIQPHNLNPEGVNQYNEALKRAQGRVAMSGYLSGIHNGEDQIANGQPGTALDATQRMLDAGIGMDVIGDSKAAIQEKIDTARVQGAARARAALAGAKAQTETETNAEIAQIRGALLPDANGNPPDPRVADAALARLHQLTNSSDPVVAATAGREAEAIGNVIKTQAEDRLTGRLTQDDPSALAQINAAKSVAPGQPGALTLPQLDDLRSAHRISDTTYTEQRRRLEDLTNNPQLRETESRLTQFMRGSVYSALTGDTAAPDAANPTSLFGPTVNPRAKAAYEIALNQTIARFEDMTRRGMDPNAAYKELTEPGSAGSIWHVVPYWKQVAANGPEWSAQHPIGPSGSAPPPAAPAPGVDSAMRRVQSAGPMRPDESWAAYKARAGIQ